MARDPSVRHKSAASAVAESDICGFIKINKLKLKIND
jgi:hypothetical protein